MRATLKTAALSFLFVVGGLVSAQDTGAPAAIYMSDAAVEAQLQAAAAGSVSAAGWAVSIAPGVTVRRRSSTVEQFAVMHPYSIEIYRILEGSGTLVTGGLLIPPIETFNENVIRTPAGIEGGRARQVSAGDILVLQPGTPHWFSAIDGETLTYMESRVRIATNPIQYQ